MSIVGRHLVQFQRGINSKEGDTEKIIGTWMKERKVRPRKDVVICTKLAGAGRYVRMRSCIVYFLELDRFVDMIFQCYRSWHGIFGKQLKCSKMYPQKNIMKSCEASLKRLDTDYIDVYMLNWPQRYSPQTNWGQSLRYNMEEEEDSYWRSSGGPISYDSLCLSMEDLIKKVKIRGWGLCNDNAYRRRVRGRLWIWGQLRPVPCRAITRYWIEIVMKMVLRRLHRNTMRMWVLWDTPMYLRGVC